MKLITFRNLRIFILILALLLLAPGAHAQMPLAPGGLIQINPPFEGAQLIWSSATISSYDWWGEYRLDVLPGVVVGAPHNVLSPTHADTVTAALVVGDVLYVDAVGDLNRLAAGPLGFVFTQGVAIPGWVAPGAVGAGIWQPDVVRGFPVADLIAVHQGRPGVIYDWTSTDYLEMGNVLNTMSYFYTIDGNMEVYGTDVAYQFRVNEMGAIPSAGAPDFIYLQHDTTDGEIGTNAGDLQLNAFADIVSEDFHGFNNAAPSEWIDVIGSIQMVDGTEGVGNIAVDDGTGTGVMTWASLTALTGGTWFLYDTASGDIAGYDTLFADPSVGGVQSYNIAIPASPTLIEEFATEVGEPAITFINDGLIEFHFHARRSAGTMDARVYAEIYTRTLVPVETLIATTELSNIMTNVQAAYEVHANVAFTAMNVTDRLVVKVYANQIPPGANPTVQFYVEGATATRLELPGADTGSALSHTVATVVFNGADPTPVILEAGVADAARDFFVDVQCTDVNGGIVWPAFGSKFPVANLVTYYWFVDADNLTVNIVNDSPKDIVATIWWTR